MKEPIIVNVRRIVHKKQHNKRSARHSGIMYQAQKDQTFAQVTHVYGTAKTYWTSAIVRMTFNPRTKLVTIYTKNKKIFLCNAWSPYHAKRNERARAA